MNRSHEANRYGIIVERQAAEWYSLEIDRCSWHDARRSGGTPVDIKAAMYRHTDSQFDAFNLYDQYHEQLGKRTGGTYSHRIGFLGVMVTCQSRRYATRHSNRTQAGIIEGNIVMLSGDK